MGREEWTRQRRGRKDDVRVRREGRKGKEGKEGRGKVPVPENSETRVVLPVKPAFKDRKMGPVY